MDGKDLTAHSMPYLAKNEGVRPTRGKRLHYDVLNHGGTDLSLGQSEIDDDGFDSDDLDGNTRVRGRGRGRPPKRGRGAAAASENTKSWGAGRPPPSAKSTGATTGVLDVFDESASSKKEDYICKIERILFRKTMTHVEWREYLSAPKYHTSDIIRGSVWAVPDDIWYDNSEDARTKYVTRYLVKWKDKSYLHVSWELHGDLMNEDICVLALNNNEKGYAKRTIKDLLQQMDTAVQQGQKIFPDLRIGEYFPPEWTQIEKILLFKDTKDANNITAVGSENGPLSAYESTASSLPRDFQTGLPHSYNVQSLHEHHCKVLIKWRGLDYSMTSLEDVGSLQSCGVTYKDAIRDYFRRIAAPAQTLAQEAMWTIPLDVEPMGGTYLRNEEEESEHYRGESDDFGVEGDHGTEVDAAAIDEDDDENDNTSVSKRAANRNNSDSGTSTSAGTGEKRSGAVPRKQRGKKSYRFFFPNGNQLLPHQTQALAWLIRQYHRKRHCVVCDEQGLGRTTLVAAFLHASFGRNPNGQDQAGMGDEEENGKEAEEQEQEQEQEGQQDEPAVQDGASDGDGSEKQEPMQVVMDPNKAATGGIDSHDLGNGADGRASAEVSRAPVEDPVSTEAEAKVDKAPPSEQAQEAQEAQEAVPPSPLPPSSSHPTSTQTRVPVPGTSSFLIVCALDRIQNIEKEIIFWTGRRPIIYHHADGQANKKKAKELDLLFDGGISTHAPIVITTTASLISASATPMHDTELKEHPWSAVIWLLETNEVPVKGSSRDPFIKRRKEQALLKRRAATLHKVGRYFQNAQWWCLLRCATVHGLSAGGVGESRPAEQIILPTYYGRPINRELEGASVVRHHAKHDEATSYVYMEVKKRASRAGAVEGEEEEAETYIDRGGAKFRHPDTDFTDVIPLSATAHRLVPSSSIVPPPDALCLTLEINRSEDLAAQAQSEDMDEAQKVSLRKLSEEHRVKAAEAACAYGIHSSAPPSRDPTMLPISDGEPLLIEELWLFLAFLYPDKYLTLSSVQAALSSDFAQRNENGRQTLMKGARGEASPTEEQANCGLARLLELPQGGDYEHGKHALSPYNVSSLSPVILPLLSRSYTQVMVPYLRRQRYYQKTGTTMPNVSVFVGSGSDDYIWLYHSLGDVKPQECGLNSPGLPGCHLRIGSHQTIGRVHSTTASILLTPLQARVLLRLWTVPHTMETLSRLDRLVTEPSSASSSDPSNIDTVVHDLFYLIRRASMDAGLVSRAASGAFGSAIQQNCSIDHGDGKEYRAAPIEQLTERADSKVASSLEVDDLCASSGKLEYLRALVDSGRAASALKPTMIFVQYRDAADRVAALLQGMGVPYARVDDSLDYDPFQREVASFSDPALFCISQLVGKAGASKPSSSSSSSSSSSRGGRRGVGGGGFHGRGPNCDVMIVGMRKDSSLALTGLGPAVRRAKLFLLYDGISDEIGRENEMKMLRTIHTIKNMPTLDEIDDHARRSPAGTGQQVGEASAIPSADMLSPPPQSPTEQVLVVRLVVSDSIENIMLRALRELRYPYQEETNQEEPDPSHPVQAVAPPLNLSPSVPKPEGDGVVPGSWPWQMSRLLKPEPPSAKELLDECTSRASPDRCWYAHEALSGLGLSRMVSSTNSTVVYLPSRLVGEQMEANSNVMHITIRQAALLSLLSARRSYVLLSNCDGEGAPPALRINRSLAQYHDSYHPPPTVAADAETAARHANPSKGRKRSGGSGGARHSSSDGGAPLEIDLTTGEYHFSGRKSAVEDEDEDEDEEEEDEVADPYHDIVVTDGLFWTTFGGLARKELYVAEASIATQPAASLSSTGTGSSRSVAAIIANDEGDETFSYTVHGHAELRPAPHADQWQQGWRSQVAPYAPSPCDTQGNDDDEDDTEDPEDESSSDDSNASGTDGLAEFSKDLHKVTYAKSKTSDLRSPLVATCRLVKYDDAGVPVFLRERGEPVFRHRRILTARIDKTILDPPTTYLPSKSGYSLVTPTILRRHVVWSALLRYQRHLKGRDDEGQRVATKKKKKQTNRSSSSSSASAKGSRTKRSIDMAALVKDEPNKSRALETEVLTPQAMHLMNVDAINATLEENFKAILRMQETSELQTLRRAINLVAAGHSDETIDTLMRVSKRRRSEIEISVAASATGGRAGKGTRSGGSTTAASSSSSSYSSSSSTHASRVAIELNKPYQRDIPTDLVALPFLSEEDRLMVHHQSVLKSLFHRFRLADERRRQFIQWMATIHTEGEAAQRLVRLFQANAAEGWHLRRRPTIAYPSIKATIEKHHQVAGTLSIDGGGNMVMKKSLVNLAHSAVRRGVLGAQGNVEASQQLSHLSDVSGRPPNGTATEANSENAVMVMMSYPSEQSAQASNRLISPGLRPPSSSSSAAAATAAAAGGGGGGGGGGAAVPRTAPVTAAAAVARPSVAPSPAPITKAPGASSTAKAPAAPGASSTAKAPAATAASSTAKAPAAPGASGAAGAPAATSTAKAPGAPAASGAAGAPAATSTAKAPGAPGASSTAKAPAAPGASSAAKAPGAPGASGAAGAPAATAATSAAKAPGAPVSASRPMPAPVGQPRTTTTQIRPNLVVAVYANRTVKEALSKIIHQLACERMWVALMVQRMKYRDDMATARKEKEKGKGQGTGAGAPPALTPQGGNVAAGALSSAAAALQSERELISNTPFELPLTPSSRNALEGQFIHMGRQLSLQSREALLMALLRYGYGRWDAIMGAHSSLSNRRKASASTSFFSSSQGFFVSPVRSVFAEYTPRTHLPYWTDMIVHTLILAACSLDAPKSLPPQSETPTGYASCSAIEPHVFESLSALRLWRLLQHSVITRYYCHKMLSELDQEMGESSEKEPVIIGVAMHSTVKASSKGATAEGLSASEALDYVSGFPYYSWGAAATSKACPKDQKPALDLVLKVLKDNFNNRFPMVIRSPFFIQRLRKQVRAGIEETLESLCSDHHPTSLFLSRTQPTYYLEEDHRSDNATTVVVAILERLDRLFEVQNLFTIHRHFSVDASVKGYEKDGTVTAEKSREHSKSSKGKGTAKKRAKGAVEKDKEGQTDLVAAASEEGRRANFLMHHCRKPLSEICPDRDLSPYIRQDTAYAPSLLVSSLVHPTVKKQLSRGRLPLGALLGSAQDLAVLLSAAHDGWPESISRQPGKTQESYRRLHMPWLDSPVSITMVNMDRPLLLDQATEVFLLFGWGLCLWGKTPRERLRVNDVFSSTSWALSEKLWFSRAHLPRAVREHMSFLDAGRHAVPEAEPTDKPPVPVSVNDLDISVAGGGAQRAHKPSDELLSFSSPLSLHFGFSDLKCDALVSLVDLSRRLREILRAVVPMMIQAGMMTQVQTQAAAKFGSHSAETESSSSLLTRSFGAVPSLLRTTTDTLSALSGSAPSTSGMGDYSQRLAVDSLGLGDLLDVSPTAKLASRKRGRLGAAREAGRSGSGSGDATKVQASGVAAAAAGGGGGSASSSSSAAGGPKASGVVGSEHPLPATWSPRCFERRLVNCVAKHGIPRCDFDRISPSCQARFTIADFIERGDFTVTELPLVLVGLSHVLCETTNGGKRAPYKLVDGTSEEGIVRSMTPLTNMRPRWFGGVCSPLRVLLKPLQWMPPYLEKFSAGVENAQAVSPTRGQLQPQTRWPGSDEGEEPDATSILSLTTLEKELDSVYKSSDAARKGDGSWSLAKWDDALRQRTSCEVVFHLNLKRYSLKNNEAEIILPSSRGSFRNSSSTGIITKAGYSYDTDERYSVLDPEEYSAAITFLNDFTTHSTFSAGAFVHTARTGHYWGGRFDRDGGEEINEQTPALGTDSDHVPSPAALSRETLHDVIHLMDTIRLIVMCGQISPDVHAVGMVAGQMPEWWTQRHTLLLLTGICKFGWRAWDQIIYDGYLDWKDVLPENWLHILLAEEETALLPLYGERVLSQERSELQPSERAHVGRNPTEKKLIDKIHRIRCPNKPSSLLLRNVSAEQFERLCRATADNYVESLLSWCAPVPLSKREMESGGNLIDLLPPPSSAEIVHFYATHNRFPSHADYAKNG